MKSGEKATIGGFTNDYNTVVAVLNALTGNNSRPETFGAQHLPSLVLASDVVLLSGTESVATWASGGAIETQASMKADWAESPTLVWNAGAIIPRPCILVEICQINVPGDGAPPDNENLWLLTTLWHQVDGSDADNGAQHTRSVRPFSVGVAGATVEFPSRCIGKPITLFRATEYDDSAPNLSLERVSLRYVIRDHLGVHPTYTIRDGFLGFFALAKPG